MRVNVSGRQFIFPRCCACCGAYPVTTLAVCGTERNKRARTKGWTWQIPYCMACKRHIKLRDIVLIGTVIASGVVVILGAVTAIVADQFSRGLTVTLLLLLAVLIFCRLIFRLIDWKLPENCYIIGRAVEYLGSDGSCHSFDFKSSFYASDFIRANHHKIVNASPSVASILGTTGFGKHQVPRRLVRHS